MSRLDLHHALGGRGSEDKVKNQRVDGGQHHPLQGEFLHYWFSSFNDDPVQDLDSEGLLRLRDCSDKKSLIESDLILIPAVLAQL